MTESLVKPLFLRRIGVSADSLVFKVITNYPLVGISE